MKCPENKVIKSHKYGKLCKNYMDRERRELPPDKYINLALCRCDGKCKEKK